MVKFGSLHLGEITREGGIQQMLVVICVSATTRRTVQIVELILPTSQIRAFFETIKTLK